MIFDEDYIKKRSVKLNNKEFQIAHNTIKKNSNVIITNPQNNKSITLKVYKKSKQIPDFFKAIITKKFLISYFQSRISIRRYTRT